MTDAKCSSRNHGPERRVPKWHYGHVMLFADVCGCLRCHAGTRAIRAGCGPRPALGLNSMTVEYICRQHIGREIAFKTGKRMKPIVFLLFASVLFANILPAVAQDTGANLPAAGGDPCTSLVAIAATHMPPLQFARPKPEGVSNPVKILATVAPDGSVADVALAPSGSSGLSSADDAALRAVKETWRWQSRPANCASIKTEVDLVFFGQNIPAIGPISCQTLRPDVRTHMVPPQYARKSRSDQVKLVKIQVTIGADGKVIGAEITPDGSSGNPEIDAIGTDYVKNKWLWAPRDASCAPLKTLISLMYG